MKKLLIIFVAFFISFSAFAEESSPKYFVGAGSDFFGLAIPDQGDKTVTFGINASDSFSFATGILAGPVWVVVRPKIMFTKTGDKDMVISEYLSLGAMYGMGQLWFEADVFMANFIEDAKEYGVMLQIGYEFPVSGNFAFSIYGYGMYEFESKLTYLGLGFYPTVYF